MKRNPSAPAKAGVLSVLQNKQKIPASLLKTDTKLSSKQNLTQKEKIDPQREKEKDKEELLYQQNPILMLFDDEISAELYNSRAHDTGEPINSLKL